LVCALCDLELGGRHVCPSCLPGLEKAGRWEVLERQRTRYDSVVWTLLILPVFFLGFAAPLIIPLALALMVWKWRSPPSRVVRTHLRMTLAIPVALVELGFGVWIWVWAFGGWSYGG
jgi:hypothetical protein